MKSRNPSLFFSLALAIGACGGEKNQQPAPEEAYLTIVGDANVFVGHGAQTVLRVRYHDANDEPLAGEVAFAASGEPGGSTLGAEIAETNADGIVELSVAAGDSDAAFTIEATAGGVASPAVFNVVVGSPFDVFGTYDLESNFDMVSGLPGDLGIAVNGLIDIADDPNDPATWLLDRVEDEIGFGLPGRSFLDPKVNEVIKNNAPELVGDLVAMTDAFGQVARSFGTDTALEITEASGAEGMIATHTMQGFFAEIDGQTYRFSNQDLGVEATVAETIAVSVERDQVSFGEHRMPLAYGGFLALALEEAIIPALEPSATSLHEFLEIVVDCAAVGQKLADEVGILSANTYAGACDTALQFGAEAAVAELRDLEGAGVELAISGSATMAETTGDRAVDSFDAGSWTGSVDYFGEAAALDGDANRFTGTRR